MPAAIRLASSVDAGQIARIYAPHVESAATSFETAVPTDSEMSQRIADTLIAYPWLVYEENAVVGGYAYATKHRVRAAYQWAVEVSVYVDEAFRRRRIAQALYRSLFRILAAQHYVVAYAGITLPNAASVALHESVDFEPIGVYRRIGYKLGAWHDVGWWERVVHSRDIPPAEPTPLAEIAATPEFADMLRAGLPLVRASAGTA
jgi:L-amino acid N-acyltransferase YncA